MSYPEKSRHILLKKNKKETCKVSSLLLNQDSRIAAGNNRQSEAAEKIAV